MFARPRGWPAAVTPNLSRCFPRALALLLGWLAAGAVAWAQTRTAERKDEPPPPEEIVLRTADQVQLAATFYPSTKGKNAVPVILLHMSKGSRADYRSLGPYLQRLGHAVLAADLRGHGGSKTQMVAGKERDLTVGKLRPADYKAMVTYDMETLKAYLMGKNNAGELNIDKLAVVGAELGAVVALEWARLDWSWPPLTVGKQGQDVKALVLLSPQWTVESLHVSDSMAHPAVRAQLSIFIVYGDQDAKATREAKKFHQTFARHHPTPKAEEVREKQDLFLAALPTSLQGTKLLGVQGLKTEAFIGQFLNVRLVSKTDYPWRDRTIR